MDSWLVFRRDREIVNHQWTKRNDWSIKRFSKTSFTWSLLIKQEILNVSQISIAFHGICPPFFIQTWPQQYRRCTFFHSAHYSFSNPICFQSVWCWRTMIPGKIFTSLANFQGTVSVNDFRLPILLQELLQAPFGFLRSFCFARIRLNPLGGQVLHHDCISMLVSRFIIFTENYVICCNQVTKICCTRYGSTDASSARCPCNFCPLTDLTISVFGEVSFNTVFTQIHTFHRFLRWFMRRTRVWVSVFRNSFILKILAEFFQPLSEFNRSWSSSFFGFGFFFLTSVLPFQHVNLTRLRDGDPSHTGSPRSCLSTLSLDTVEDVMGGWSGRAWGRTRW